MRLKVHDPCSGPFQCRNDPGSTTCPENRDRPNTVRAYADLNSADAFRGRSFVPCALFDMAAHLCSRVVPVVTNGGARAH